MSKISTVLGRGTVVETRIRVIYREKLSYSTAIVSVFFKLHFFWCCLLRRFPYHCCDWLFKFSNLFPDWCIHHTPAGGSLLFPKLDTMTDDSPHVVNQPGFYDSA
ncbi:hypothetical protein OUZ56_021163 [Daphnia magna]|uniref:Uncharacterized protein n=1 Tax=Daphnia magna TaxID=35525 RepID=A0ABQ9ZGJ9_9CRUS|nr:hypothetical protein OUZ56_021163 [Daphnia magna]